MSDLIDAVDGFETGDPHSRDWKSAQGVNTAPLRDIVTKKLTQKRRVTGYEVDYLKQHSPGPIKMTLPSANQFPAIAYRKGLSEKAYPSYSDFLRDVTAVLDGEMKALADEGVAYIQIDAPRYSTTIWTRSGATSSRPNTIRTWTCCSTKRSPKTTPAFAPGVNPGWPWPFTSVAATTAVTGTPPAATTPSRKRCSMSSTASVSCSNTTTSARGRSNRYVSCRKAKSSFLGW